jgi:hypothetical protein
MAFVDTDEDGNKFANVTFAVGPGKANITDDVIVVQIAVTQAFFGPGKFKGKPLAESIDVTKIKPGVFDDATGQLIAGFQREFLHRPKPQGYVQRAIGKNKSSFTIWWLYLQLNTVLARDHDPRSGLDFLRAFAPVLASSLKDGVITIPTVEIRGKARK